MLKQLKEDKAAKRDLVVRSINKVTKKPQKKPPTAQQQEEDNPDEWFQRQEEEKGDQRMAGDAEEVQPEGSGVGNRLRGMIRDSKANAAQEIQDGPA